MIHRMFSWSLSLLILLHLSGPPCWAMSDVEATDQQKGKEESPRAIQSQKAEKDAPIEMKLGTSKREFRYPEPVTIQVFLYKPYPVAGAGVSASVISPSGRMFEIQFSEDLLIGSTTPGSGSYVAILTDLQEDGRYQVNIRADDSKGRAHFAVPFGEDVAGPKKNLKGEHTRARPGPFDITQVFYFHASGYEGHPGLPPLKVTTLYASVDSQQCVHLSWQVPLNIGNEGKYEIRYTSERPKLRKDWLEAPLLHRGEYINKGGESEEYKICQLSSGMYYFVVISENSQGIKSAVSNVYTVVIK